MSPLMIFCFVGFGLSVGIGFAVNDYLSWKAEQDSVKHFLDTFL